LFKNTYRIILGSAIIGIIALSKKFGILKILR